MTFGPGPLGLGLKTGPNGVQVSTVVAAHQAAKQAVAVGMHVLKVGDRSVVGFDVSAVTAAIKKSERPFTMLFRVG